LPHKLNHLVVDLDGTLIKSDLLVESLFALLRKSPLIVFLIPFWLLKGKAHFKQSIANLVDIDATTLPYNKDILDYLENEKTKGRKIVLATASNKKYANAIGEHLKIFDRIIASDENTNMSGSNKGVELSKLFGAHNFTYAGNANIDLEVWKHASSAVVVNPSSGLLKKVRAMHRVERAIENRPPFIKTLFKAMRIHQWVKNFLIFIPLLLSHAFIEGHYWVQASLAFLSFSLCASSVYLLNDLVDLPDDRVHARKCNRPFASGNLDAAWGLLLIPALLLSAFGIALFLPLEFGLCLLGYYLFTTLYSFWLKRKVLIDVISLASLYTVRIIAGALALGMMPSFWLLSFSLFMFLSLAIIKRYSELFQLREHGEKKLPGRGYEANDLELLSSLGGSSGYVSALVLALYLNSVEVVELYSHPEYLWLICPIILYWISRAWLIAHRGLMHDDPIVWAIRDRLSHIVTIIVILIILVAI
jgi:4-hydroxybenzoate polyprenyltransferase/phosphoserine phosphatase